jgi:hypothetical protein
MVTMEAARLVAGDADKRGSLCCQVTVRRVSNDLVTMLSAVIVINVVTTLNDMLSLAGLRGNIGWLHRNGR